MLDIVGICGTVRDLSGLRSHSADIIILQHIKQLSIHYVTNPYTRVWHSLSLSILYLYTI